MYGSRNVWPNTVYSKYVYSTLLYLQTSNTSHTDTLFTANTDNEDNEDYEEVGLRRMDLTMLSTCPPGKGQEG